MFQFVPRKVAKNNPRPPQLAASASSSTAPPQAPVPGLSGAANRAQSPEHGTNIKRKGKITEVSTKDDDLAALLWLSLSDHSLWANADLRRTMSTADGGWISLSYLFQQSSYLPHLSSRPPDTSVVRAVRAHAEELLEVRMLVTAPSKGNWYGKEQTSKEESGGYEIRRKDWEDALSSVHNSTRNEWELRTVYLEAIPLPYRSVPGIYRFASSFLPSPAHGVTPRIQSITLPPHHLDRPGDVPKCKGFALVVFREPDDATRLVAGWPWLPRRTSAAPEEEDGDSGSSSGVRHEAVRFGFRTLSKTRWDKLREEYLACRQRLLDDIADADTDEPYAEHSHERGQTTREERHAYGDAELEEKNQAPPRRPALDAYAPFPPGCLVFVRNVHPETNKTTLKTLFAAHTFGASAPAALDYVDYAKGMTSCHLRLSTPEHAQTLAAAFWTRPLVQREGLDGAGELALSPDYKAIALEVVDGEREALYWDKVPEKVRREAVRKAVAQASSSSGGGFGEGDEDGDRDVAGVEGERGDAPEDQQYELGKRSRKRRRKG